MLASITALLHDLWVSLVKALGIVWPEVWIQMLIFVIAYMALSQLIFKPYLKAYTERQKSTEGNEELAERLVIETEELNKEFEKQAKHLNAQYKAIYDETRTKAIHERDQIVDKARQEATVLMTQSKEEITAALNLAKVQLERETPALSTALTNKLLGRELTQ